MKYLLDTDICIYLIKHKPASVRQKLSTIPNKDVGLSVISVFELQFGVENSQHPKKSQTALNHFVAAIPNILPVDTMAAKYGARVRAELKKMGTPIGAYDLLIASIALSQGLTLVSNNIQEFSRIKGLKLESWV